MLRGKSMINLFKKRLARILMNWSNKLTNEMKKEQIFNLHKDFFSSTGLGLLWDVWHLGIGYINPIPSLHNSSLCLSYTFSFSFQDFQTIFSCAKSSSLLFNILLAVSWRCQFLFIYLIIYSPLYIYVSCFTFLYNLKLWRIATTSDSKR